MSLSGVGGIMDRGDECVGREEGIASGQKRKEGRRGIGGVLRVSAGGDKWTYILGGPADYRSIHTHEIFSPPARFTHGPTQTLFLGGKF